MSKKLIPLGGNVIVKCHTKKSPIVLADDPTGANRNIQLEKSFIYSVGSDVKNLAEGDEVALNPDVFRIVGAGINPHPDKEKEENVGYLMFDQKYVTGKYEKQ